MDDVRAASCAVDYIVSHSRERLAVSDVARAVGYSASQLTRLLVRVTRTSPNRYLAAARIEDAKALLSQTSMTVLEFCHAVGYDSVGTFTRRFTQAVGITPTQFRALDTNAYTSPAEVNGPAVVQGDGAITGTVLVDDERLHGVRTWVGLFPRPVPVGVPLTGATVPAGGRFALSLPPQRCWLLAAAFPKWGERPWVAELDTPAEAGEVELQLRPWQPHQHPVTVALPPLGAQRPQHDSHHRRPGPAGQASPDSRWREPGQGHLERVAGPV